MILIFVMENTAVPAPGFGLPASGTCVQYETPGYFQAESRKPKAESRKPEAGSRKPEPTP